MATFKKRHELYKITDGNKEYNLTNANRFVTHENVVYTPAPIERDRIELKSEMEKQEVGFTFDISHEVAQRYLSEVIESNISITVFENFDGQYIYLWRGRLVSVSVDDESVKLRFESIYSKMVRTGAYRRYQRTCPHVLYGENCRANREAFSTNAIVLNQGRNIMNVLVLGAFANNFFTGGLIESGDGISRTITKQVVDAEPIDVDVTEKTVYEVINLDYMNKVFTKTVEYNDESYVFETIKVMPYDQELIDNPVTNTYTQSSYLYTLNLFNSFYQNIVGEFAKISAGCDKKSTTCKDKFDNILNFGGFPYMPSDNPFVVSLT